MSDTLTTRSCVRVTVNGPAKKDPASCRSCDASVSVVTFKHGAKRLRILDEKGQITWITMSDTAADSLALLLTGESAGSDERDETDNVIAQARRWSMGILHHLGEQARRDIEALANLAQDYHEGLRVPPGRGETSYERQA